MSSNKHGLGRGLEALLGDEDLNFDFELNDNEKSGVKTVDISLLQAGRFQPRSFFDENKIDGLAQSISENGILQPLLVRKIGNKYEIIAGERRYRAAVKTGLTEVPVIEKEFTDDKALEIALVENIVRQDLNDIEEAKGYQQLMDTFFYTQEKISKIVGKSRSYIANSLRLLNLPEEIKNLVENSELSAGHARCLVGVENATDLARKIINNCLNVRQTEELVANLKKSNEEKNKSTNTKIKDIELIELEKTLSKKIGLKVQICAGKKGKGRVVLNYQDLSELENIINKLEN